MRWAIGLLAVGIVTDLTALGSGMAERQLLERLADGEIVAGSELDANDLRQLAVASVQTSVFILTAVAFIAWFRRAYDNLEVLGAEDLRYGSGWATGGWFAPILNWWRPKQIANDIWRASDPELPLDQGPMWKDGRVPALLAVWWAAYVVTNLLYTAGTRASFSADEIGDFQSFNAIFLAADLVAVAAGILAIFVVRRTTGRQQARATRLGADPEELPTPVWRRRSSWAVGLAVLLAAGFQAALGAAAWTGALAETGAGTPRSTPSAAVDEGSGILLRDDFSQQGVWLVEDTPAATFDYAAAAYRISVKKPDELWSSLYALPERVESMSVEIDLTLQAGRVVSDYYGVGCVASSQGSYLFGISPDGYHTIAFDPGGDEELDVDRLVEETADRGFRQGDDSNRIRAECVRQGSRTQLRLLVNGAEIAKTTHSPSLGDFVGVQLFAYSGKGGTEVRFDDLLAEVVSP